MASRDLLSRIQHIVVLMLENRSVDSMLGFLYDDQGSKSPSGQPFEGLTGKETNPASRRKSIPVFTIKPTDKNAYFMPGIDPGEGYAATIWQCQCSDAPGRHQPGVRQGLLLYTRVGEKDAKLDKTNPAGNGRAEYHGHLHP